ncbi:MAG: hypothetical protein AB7F86_05450 [Bdellovibrionales bacterium]
MFVGQSVINGFTRDCDENSLPRSATGLSADDFIEEGVAHSGFQSAQKSRSGSIRVRCKERGIVAEVIGHGGAVADTQFSVRSQRISVVSMGQMVGEESRSPGQLQVNKTGQVNILRASKSLCMGTATQKSQ